MEQITINVNKLIDKLIKNREIHKKEIKKLNKNYRKIIIDTLSTRLRLIKEDGNINPALNIPRPEDHTEDYDIAIEMLRYETRDEVKIDRRQFENYVLDKWGRKIHADSIQNKFRNNNPLKSQL